MVLGLEVDVLLAFIVMLRPQLIRSAMVLKVSLASMVSMGYILSVNVFVSERLSYISVGPQFGNRCPCHYTPSADTDGTFLCFRLLILQ
jgi:hypothetical protein